MTTVTLVLDGDESAHVAAVLMRAVDQCHVWRGSRKVLVNRCAQCRLLQRVISRIYAPQEISTKAERGQDD